MVHIRSDQLENTNSEYELTDQENADHRTDVASMIFDLMALHHKIFELDGQEIADQRNDVAACT